MACTGTCSAAGCRSMIDSHLGVHAGSQVFLGGSLMLMNVAYFFTLPLDPSARLGILAHLGDFPLQHTSSQSIDPDATGMPGRTG